MASSFNPTCLANNVALITGGGSGICYGIAKKFMQHGADIAILSRNYEKLCKSAQTLCESVPGRTCYPIQCDVRNYEAMSSAIDKVLEKFGKLNILINGAAGNFLCPISQLSYNAFKTVMEIDAHGTFIASKLAYMKALQHSGGVILNISMTLHYTGTPFQIHAGAAKSAIDGMTKHMAVEFGPNNVRVNGIAPGPIKDTPGMSILGPSEDGNDPEQESMYSNFVNSIPLQKMGSADDIASSALFLCTKEASYITGATLVVDGGQWLTGASLFTQQKTETHKSHKKIPQGKL